MNVHHYRGSGYNATNHILTLTDGGAFQDPANDITISQISRDGATAAIQVTYVLTCNEATPTVGIGPSMHLVRPGEIVDFSVSVTNQDRNGCPQTTFGLAQTGAVTGVLNAGSLTLPAGQAGTASIRVATAGLAMGRMTRSCRRPISTARTRCIWRAAVPAFRSWWTALRRPRRPG